MHNIQSGIRRVGQGHAAPVDADRHAADEIAHADRDPGPEQRESRVRIRRRVHVGGGHVLELGGEDNGHDDAVDGHHFAEDDGDEVLGADPRRLDAAADDGRARDEDAPGSLVRVEECGMTVPCCADYG
jgi:hypothetical protein